MQSSKALGADLVLDFLQPAAALRGEAAHMLLSAESDGGGAAQLHMGQRLGNGASLGIQLGLLPGGPVLAQCALAQAVHKNHGRHAVQRAGCL